MPGFSNGAIINWPVKPSVAVETLESNQSHYMIFVFIGPKLFTFCGSV
jgi:hypothetical protein